MRSIKLQHAATSRDPWCCTCPVESADWAGAAGPVFTSALSQSTTSTLCRSLVPRGPSCTVRACAERWVYSSVSYSNFPKFNRSLVWKLAVAAGQNAWQSRHILARIDISSREWCTKGRDRSNITLSHEKVGFGRLMKKRFRDGGPKDVVTISKSRAK